MATSAVGSATHTVHTQEYTSEDIYIYVGMYTCVSTVRAVILYVVVHTYRDNICVCVCIKKKDIPLLCICREN